MKSKTAGFCGLDIQKEYFSIVQYSSEDHMVTDLDIHSFPAESGIDEWKTWKNELKNRRGRLRFFSPSVVCSMPSEYALIKPVMLDADEQDIAGTIQWELGQQVIGTLDEYVFDYEEIRGAPDEPVKKFLAVAYRRELVNRMAGLVRSVNLKPAIVDLDIFGLVNVFEFNYSDKKAEPCLIIHSEFDLTKFVLTYNGGFLDYHCFEHKTGSVDAGGFAVALSAETDRFLAAMQKTGGRIPVYITGSYFQQTFSREAFFEKVPGAEVLNPFRAIKCQVKIDEQQFQEYSTQLAVAVGLALRGGQETEETEISITE